MPRIVRTVPLLSLLIILLLVRPASVAGHAAFVRSDPAPGAALSEAPKEIRIWFAEPLEHSYTRGTLLDATGSEVAGVTSAIAGNNSHELVMSLPRLLVDGGYTVAWRTLSAADGHTMEGYFGFRVGKGDGGGTLAVAPNSSGNDTLRALSRWLAILGLAMLIAIGPTTLLVVDPAARANPSLGSSLRRWPRRYGMLAIALSLIGSAVALTVQAVSIAPEASLPGAIAQTLSDTRYGQLWLLRLGILLVCAVAVGCALWGKEGWKRSALVVASIAGLIAPWPFSLLSHASAQRVGQGTAVASDALHLLRASIWAGGLLMLVLVLLPALRPLSPQMRRAALKAAIPRFSVLGVAAWAVLVLSGLYAAWLQVGTIEALRETDYGRTLLLKGALLLPVLALAAYHFLIGRRGVEIGDVLRTARTLAAEALLVVAVLLVVGRLIGLEPAREVIAGRALSALIVPLSFATGDGVRGGQLAISPGAAGTNTFTLLVDGTTLPDGAKAVLRFALPSQEIGQQELKLPADGPNQFRAEGSELSLAGRWQIDAIVRKIGSFSWNAATMATIDEVPPPAPEPNPPPRFSSLGAAGMIAIAIGMCALATGTVSRGMSDGPRRVSAIAGTVALIGGLFVLNGSRLPRVVAGSAGETTASLASPGAIGSPHEGGHAQASPVVEATPQAGAQAAGVGTPVAGDGFSVTIGLDAQEAGPIDVKVNLVADDGKPVSGAHVVVANEMSGMGRVETAATEGEPGLYAAQDVPLSMAGEWRMVVRVSPRGEATQVLPFVVTVP